MTTITFQGKPCQTIGELPQKGRQVPDFTLTKTDLSEITLKSCLGKQVILNIFPSLDTDVCANSVLIFNEKANQLPGIMILCVSADLPFAQKRFCGANNLTHVIPASTFRHPEFGQHFGVTIKEGPLSGLLSRAIVIFDAQGKVTYTQQVPEITMEPDYQAVFTALS